MGEHLKRLKELRLAKGVYQKEIAEYLGISVQAYSLYEKGNREPNIEMLKKIAEYYSVSLDYLMGQEKKEPLTFAEFFSGTRTIAAHFDGEEYTEEELEEIKQFAEFVKSKRKSPQYWDGLKNSLQVAAAHNDHAEEPGELEKMQEDAEMLLNAAHRRTDIDIPKGADASDNDIMDDTNF